LRELGYIKGHGAREVSAGSTTRRATIARELVSIETRIDRLPEAVAAGTGATPALLAKRAKEETRRSELTRERDALGTVDHTLDLTQARGLRAIRARAVDIRTSLLEHRDEARDVLPCVARGAHLHTVRTGARARLPLRG
jgi:hypothetical protein